MKPERTKEEILQVYSDDPKNWCLAGNYTLTDGAILRAMEEYRSQSSPVESKWVSVKERQPEYMDVVLIYAALGFVTMAQYGGGNTFCLGDESYSATHWMPLPLSPELPPIEETKEK